MSSSRIVYTRKRRSDDECSSSDIEEDAPPVKRACKLEPNYSEAFVRKLRSFCSWVQRLPLGKCDETRDSLIKCSLEGLVSIDSDGEDIEIVDINTEDDLIVDEEFTCIPDMSGRRENFHKNSMPVPGVTHPLSSSTPFYRGQNGNRGRPLKSILGQHLNGCSNSKTYPTRNKDCIILPKMRCNRNVAPLSNPKLDVEILFDTRETPGEESDDLEIVSEIPNTKTSKRLTRQTVSSRVISKFGKASKEYNGTSPGSIVNEKTDSCERPRSSTSYTAYEVIRLQEKERYKQILDKMVVDNTYRPVTPKKSPKPTEIQVDLTEDDEPVIANSLKKGDLDGFLEKYYKPVDFVPVAPPKDNSELEIFTLDDDVQVIQPEASYESCNFKSKLKKGSSIFENGWLDDFKKAVNSAVDSRMQLIATQTDIVERCQKRRDAKISKGRILRGLSISSDQSEQDEFPELTPDMNKRIDWAFGAGSGMETLSTFKDCLCNRSDMLTLSGLNWLNDSVINFYLSLIKERSKNHPVYPPVFVFNSYFYTSLKTRGAQSVLRWTRKIEDGKNIFQFDIVFVPLHLGMHWALCVVDNRKKKIKYYDSMQGTDDQCLRILQNYLVVEKKDKQGIVMDPSAYSLEIVKDIPQQMNGSDCGMFTLKYAEYISRDAPISFSQENMQYFRRRMVIEILDKKLF